ncbi:MAG: hypothetical protein V4682_01900 [Patescibacteria group bacterium]
MNPLLKALVTIGALAIICYAGYLVLVRTPASERISINQYSFENNDKKCEDIPSSWRYLDSDEIGAELLRDDITYRLPVPEWWKVIQVPDRTEGMILLAVDETRIEEQTLLKEGIADVDWLALYRFDTFFTSADEYHAALHDSYEYTADFVEYGSGIDILDFAEQGTIVREIWVGGKRGQVLRLAIHSPRGRFAEGMLDCAEISGIGYQENVSFDSYDWPQTVDTIVGFAYSYPENWFFRVEETPVRAFDARHFYNQETGGTDTGVMVYSDSGRDRTDALYLKTFPEIVNSITQGNNNALVLQRLINVRSAREGNVDGYLKAYRAHVLAVGDLIAFEGEWGTGAVVRTMAHTYVSLEP